MKRLSQKNVRQRPASAPRTKSDEAVIKDIKQAAARNREAHHKKPTQALLNSLGVVTDPLEALVQRHRGKKVTRRQNKPVKQHVESVPAVHAPPTEFRTVRTPDWFTLTSETDVSVIVPCFKSNDVILSQIASWDLSEDGLTKEIIYVDDACPLDSEGAVLTGWERRRRQLTRPVGRIVKNAKNEGFAAACNVGAKVARGKILVFLNADVEVSPGWLAPLVTEIHGGAGIAGPLILRKDGTVESCGSEWNRKHACFQHVGRHTYRGQTLAKPFHRDGCPADILCRREAEMVTGACLAISAKLYRELGGFDEMYRVGYWEDADLNMKARVRGEKIIFTPESVVYHKPGHTHSSGHPHFNRNAELFRKRWVQSRLMDTCSNPPAPAIGPAVIYTAITGGYDDLKPQPDKGVPYVAFTDLPASPPWEVRPVHAGLDANRNAKIHKVMPHKFFPDAEYSLWIDGSCRVEFPFDLARLVQTYLQDADLAVFRHPQRNCAYDEARVCKNQNLDSHDIIDRQVRRYTAEGYPSNYGLGECSVVLRRHTAACARFNEAWWQEILNGSRRDQISFNYVAWKLGFKFNYFPGSLREKNYLFVREKHKKQRR